MANREPAADQTKRIVSPELGRVARASNGTPIRTGKRTGPGKAHSVQIEAMLAELTRERLVDVWQQVCPFAIASEYGLPDCRGIIRDLADFARVLQPNLEDLTADQLCRRVERYGGAANRERIRLSPPP